MTDPTIVPVLRTHQFLTVEQFTEVGPSREDDETVKSFARADELQAIHLPQSHEPAGQGTVHNIEKAPK